MIFARVVRSNLWLLSPAVAKRGRSSEDLTARPRTYGLPGKLDECASEGASSGLASLHRQPGTLGRIAESFGRNPLREELQARHSEATGQSTTQTRREHHLSARGARRLGTGSRPVVRSAAALVWASLFWVLSACQDPTRGGLRDSQAATSGAPVAAPAPKGPPGTSTSLSAKEPLGAIVIELERCVLRIRDETVSLHADVHLENRTDWFVLLGMELAPCGFAMGHLKFAGCASHARWRIRYSCHADPVDATLIPVVGMPTHSAGRIPLRCCDLSCWEFVSDSALELTASDFVEVAASWADGVYAWVTYAVSAFDHKFLIDPQDIGGVVYAKLRVSDLGRAQDLLMASSAPIRVEVRRE